VGGSLLSKGVGRGRGWHLLGTVVRGSRVVGWVFSRGLWDLDFVLAVERERALTERTKTTNNIRRLGAMSLSGRGTWCLDLPAPPHSLVVIFGSCQLSFRDGRPSSWTLERCRVTHEITYMQTRWWYWLGSVQI
jgi:hypothetical protein